MFTALSNIDLLTGLSILVKALAYAAALVAGGSVLFGAAVSSLRHNDLRFLARLASVSAFVAALAAMARLPLRASFLMGGPLEGAVDPMILGMVADSPLGTSVVIRLMGLALILSVLFKHSTGKWLGLLGAVIVCASFAFRGHTLNEPRFILGLLLTVHILCLAFWIGAFYPLLRATRLEAAEKAGEIAEEFGRKALWAVSLLVIAGGLTLVFFGLMAPSAFMAAFGQMFLVKLGLFAVVLAFAALNKIRLTPALLAGRLNAKSSLRASIYLEAAFVTAILIVTATMTSIASPN